MRYQLDPELVRKLRKKDAPAQQLVCLRSFHLGDGENAVVGEEFTISAATAIELLASTQACFPDEAERIKEAIANEKNALKVRKQYAETLHLRPSA